MKKVSLFLATLLLVVSFPVKAQVMDAGQTQLLIRVLTLQVQMLQMQLDSLLAMQSDEETDEESDEKNDSNERAVGGDEESQVVTPSTYTVTTHIDSAVSGQTGDEVYEGILIEVFGQRADDTIVLSVQNASGDEISREDAFQGTGCNQSTCYSYNKFSVPLEDATYRVSMTINGKSLVYNDIEVFGDATDLQRANTKRQDTWKITR